MTVALVMALLQAAPALVGDTVWIDRNIAAPEGSVLRPLPWDPGEDVVQLGPPHAVPRSEGWTLRYPVVFWRPGSHRVSVPGPLVIRPSGTTDSLPPQVVTVVIQSVLPGGRVDTLTPRPAVGLLPAGGRSVQPAVLLVLLVLVPLLPLHWWWRRRGPVARVRVSGGPEVPVRRDELRIWAAGGEVRAAADGWIALFEAAPPSPERDALLIQLREARFGTGDTRSLARLCAEAAEL